MSDNKFQENKGLLSEHLEYLKNNDSSIQPDTESAAQYNERGWMISCPVAKPGDF